jgi:hypothetical protein
MNKNVFFALHLYRLPECTQFIESLNAAGRLLKKHGYTPNKGAVFCDPYIQKARNRLAKQFLESDNDIFIFIADDLEFKAEDVLKLIETPGDVVAGAYRTKQEKPQYPVGIETDINGRPITREDGCISARRVQTGFLKINRTVFEQIVIRYPGLAYYGIKNGKKVNIAHDFFPQGVHKHVWLGEDYAFCELWTGIGGKIWVVPDLDLTHYEGEKGYRGNYHEYLKKLPGGINEREGKMERVFKTRCDPCQSLKPLIDALSIKDGTMAEIGVYTGEATEIFYQSGKFKAIYSIDPWEDGYDETETISKCNNMDVVEELFDKRVSGLDGIKKIKMKSVGASELFDSGSLDFVYIDGQHTYKAAKEDILAWMPKLKKGGVLAGHDYEFYPGVKQAVDEIFGSSVVHFPDSSWSKFGI